MFSYNKPVLGTVILLLFTVILKAQSASVTDSSLLKKVIPTDRDIAFSFSPVGADSTNIDFKLKFKPDSSLKYVSVRIGSQEGSGELLAEDIEFAPNGKVFQGSKELRLKNQSIPFVKVAAFPHKQEVYLQIIGYDSDMNVIYSVKRRFNYKF